mgnify:CR=1 FL=1
MGYSKLKDCIRLMFWSGADFDEPRLKPGTGKFKDASIRYSHVDQIDGDDLKRWLAKSQKIQWDYKNIHKRKGRLERLARGRPGLPVDPRSRSSTARIARGLEESGGAAPHARARKDGRRQGTV